MRVTLQTSDFWLFAQAKQYEAQVKSNGKLKAEPEKIERLECEK